MPRVSGAALASWAVLFPQLPSFLSCPVSATVPASVVGPPPYRLSPAGVRRSVKNALVRLFPALNNMVWSYPNTFRIYEGSMLRKHLKSLTLFSDAAYIAAWMIDYCNLIGRKVVFETSETCFWGCFTLFSQWIRTMRKYCILNEVHLSSIRLQRYKIPWCFHR